MLFRGYSIFGLALPFFWLIMVHGQQIEGEEFSSAAMILSEEFLGFETSAVDMDEESDQHFLRRGLQSGLRCRPISRPTVSLQSDNPNYCNQLPNYSCTCNGSSETSCSYCALRILPTDRGIRCQVSGSILTFMDNTNTAITCGCEYAGNGEVRQSCFLENSSVPIPAPAVVGGPGASSPRAPAPVLPRAQFVTGPVAVGQFVPIPAPRAPAPVPRSPTPVPRAQFVTGSGPAVTPRAPVPVAKAQFAPVPVPPVFPRAPVPSPTIRASGTTSVVSRGKGSRKARNLERVFEEANGAH